MNNILYWPKCFAENKLDFSNDDWESLLADQLVAWGNIYAGELPPSNFFEIMQAMSVYTKCFEPDAVKARADMVIAQRKNKRD